MMPKLSEFDKTKSQEVNLTIERPHFSYLLTEDTRKYLYCSHCLEEESQMLSVCIVTRALGELYPLLLLYHGLCVVVVQNFIPVCPSILTARSFSGVYSMHSGTCVCSALGGGIVSKPSLPGKRIPASVKTYSLPSMIYPAYNIWFDKGQRRWFS